MVEKHDLAGPQGCKLAHQFAADRRTSARHHDPAPTDGLAQDGLVELQLRPVEQIGKVQELQVYGASSTMLKTRGDGRTRHLQAQLLRSVNQPQHVVSSTQLVLLVDDTVRSSRCER